MPADARWDEQLPEAVLNRWPESKVGSNLLTLITLVKSDSFFIQEFVVDVVSLSLIGGLVTCFTLLQVTTF